jgi:hypothetical protein
LASHYGHANEVNHTDWWRLSDTLVLIGILIASAITTAITRAPLAAQPILMWVVLPAYMLIGVHFGYEIGGSVSEPTMGIVIGSTLGVVAGFFARRSILREQLHAT